MKRRKKEISLVCWCDLLILPEKKKKKERKKEKGRYLADKK